MHERVFIVSENQVLGERIILEGEDVHHLTKVLRAEVGSQVIAKIPGESHFACRLEKVSGKMAELKVLEAKVIPPKTGPKTHLILSMPRPAVLSSLLPSVAQRNN